MTPTQLTLDTGYLSAIECAALHICWLCQLAPATVTSQQPGGIAVPLCKVCATAHKEGR